MDNSFTVIVALTAAIAAIISPIIVSITGRKTAIKLKEIDIVYTDKINTYKNFADSYGRIFQTSFVEPYQQFISAAYHAMLYAPPEFKGPVTDLIQYIDNDLNSKGSSKGESRTFIKCMEILLSDINRSR